MKKLLIFLIATCLMLVCIGCNDNTDVNNKNVENEQQTQVDNKENNEESNKQDDKQDNEESKIVSEATPESKKIDVKKIENVEEVVAFIQEFGEKTPKEDWEELINHLETLWEREIAKQMQENIDIIYINETNWQFALENYNFETRLIENIDQIEDESFKTWLEEIKAKGFSFFSCEGFLELEKNYQILLPYTQYMDEKTANRVTVYESMQTKPLFFDGIFALGWDEYVEQIKLYEDYLINVDSKDKQVYWAYKDAVLAWMRGMDNDPLYAEWIGGINQSLIDSYQLLDTNGPTLKMIGDWTVYIDTTDLADTDYMDIDNQATQIFNRYVGEISSLSASVTEKVIEDEDKEDHCIIEVILPVVSFAGDEALSQQINQEIEEDAMALINETITFANEVFADESADMFNDYSVYIDYGVNRNSDGMVSITVGFSYYMGGAHPNSYMIAYNFYTETGKPVILKDLFIDGYDYTAAIIEEVKNQFEDPEVLFPEGLPNYKFYFEDYGTLVVYYDPYEIAPYAAGSPEFYIHSSTFEGNMK